MAYAVALADWGDHGGYDLEVHWDECLTRAVGQDLDALTTRPLRTLSGGEQKRIALEILLRGDDDILLLDEPDNFLDVPAKRWLERELVSTRKTVLYVSHDRELLAATATKIVTVEADGAWTYGGGFAGYAEARRARLEKLAKDRAWHDEERKRLVAIVTEMRRRASFAEKFAAAAEGGREPAAPVRRAQRAAVGGARAAHRHAPRGRPHRQAGRDHRGRRARGLTDAFDLELWFGERVAVLGGNGVGKSHFLRLLAGDDSVGHEGTWRLGAGVVPGLFHQTHEHPEWKGRPLLDILHDHDVVRGPAMGMLRRYELQACAEQPFDTLSGGQQARFQILLLERSGATLLLLDEPTDNLDLVSAEALEHGLDQFTGTVIAVTHDRWFLRGFDRFVVFGADCSVTDHLDVPAAWR